MNIKITYDWLLEYLDTDASPYDLQKYLSLSGPSIERIEKIGNDHVFDIEITTNRIDMASVFGVAQEACAILPQHGKKAKLKFNPLKKYTFESLKAEPVDEKKLKITIDPSDLCQRFTALVYKGVKVTQSPEYIKRRLELVDINSINNVVDISNYLMISLGQPVHMFDYDRIQGGVMKMRESRKGEKLVTLDGKEVLLPGGDIVIEGENGSLIDLCGIMGGDNSSITKDTESIVFFVQTYDKRRIRRTSMTIGQRTTAATYFEKGLDPARVEPTFVYGIELINELCGGTAGSKLIDIYDHPRTEKKVHAYLTDIQRIMGVEIDEKKVMEILTNLGFKVKKTEEEELGYPDCVVFHVTVPTYRTDDVDIKEDIVEEVARVYGYGNLPSVISPMVHIKQPREIELLFTIQNVLKRYLKSCGLHESLNYSMISKNLIDTLELDQNSHLKIANTISSEIEYMRTFLMPSLIKNVVDNEGRRDTLRFFEIAKTYKNCPGELPIEEYKLACVVDTDFEDMKGIFDSLCDYAHIHAFTLRESAYPQFAQGKQGDIIDSTTGEVIGHMGKLSRKHQEALKLKKALYMFEIDFEAVTTHYRLIDSYKLPTQYAVLKYDITVPREGKTYAQIVERAKKASYLLTDCEFVSAFENSYTLRLYFTSEHKNLTDAEAKKEVQAIIKSLG